MTRPGRAKTVPEIDWRNRPAVYRCYDADGVLLYVGRTTNVKRRMNDHRTRKGGEVAAWWRYLARVSIKLFPTLEAASEAESLAIETEAPRFNLRHRFHSIESEPARVSLRSTQRNVDDPLLSEQEVADCLRVPRRLARQVMTQHMKTCTDGWQYYVRDSEIDRYLNAGRKAPA